MKHYVYAKRPIKQTDTNRKRPIKRLFQETWWRRAPLNMSKDWKDRIAPLVTWKRCPTVCVFVSLRFCVRMSWCLGVVCLCIFVSRCLCVYVFLCLCVFMSLCLFVCLPAYLCLCLSVCLCVCFSVCLCVCFSSIPEDDPANLAMWHDLLDNDHHSLCVCIWM